VGNPLVTVVTEKAAVIHLRNPCFPNGFPPGFWKAGFLEAHLVTVLSEKASVTHCSNAGVLAGLLPWFLESRPVGFWKSTLYTYPMHADPHTPL